MSEGRRRGHRRVVAFSVADQQRLARGELSEEQEEERRRRLTDAWTAAQGRSDGAGERANDARLAREVPPHWG